MHVENFVLYFVEISRFETIFSACQQDLSTYFKLLTVIDFVRFRETL